MQVLEWFYQRDRREQLILAVGGACLLLYILWFVILQPLGSMSERQKVANVIAAEKLARVRSLAAQLQHHQAQSTTTQSGAGGSIAELVDQTLRRNNLSMKGFQPSRSGEVKLRLDGVGFSNLLQWLHELENQHQVQVRELSIVSGNSPGYVVANMRLFKG